jgi:uncharacterized protein YbjT (DUF2867 family)
MGADQAPPEDDGGFGTYLRAKAAADQKLVASGLRYVIVRPGRLTDDPPTEHVALAEQTERGEIPRADVAAVLAAVLHEPRFDGRTFEVVGGSTRLAEAVAAFAR